MQKKSSQKLSIDLNDPALQQKLNESFKKMDGIAAEDPTYFFNNFLYTFNPKEEPYHFKFKLFPFQKRLVRDLIDAIRKGEDLFVEKCREMGATYTVLGTFLWMWLYEPGRNFLLGSRKEDYVDNRRGSTGNKEESLFGKIDYMITRLPRFILPEGWNRDKNFTFMSLVNPENGNVISGESANPNFSRGGRFSAILLDEFAFWDYGAAAWGSTADTSKCRIVLTTPGIKPSKAKRLRFGKDGEKIKVISLTYNLDPRKNKSWLLKEKARRSTEDFNREIMINWELSITGRVYPEIDNAAVGNFPLIQNSQLFVSWDFGLDGTALIFWQYNEKSGRWRIVDAYYNENQPIHFYLPLFGKPIESRFQYTDDDLKAIAEISSYPKAIHFGDPDVKKRAYASGLTMSAKKVLQKNGIFINSTTKKNNFIDRREATKLILSKGIEINYNFRTDYMYEAIKSARYPQRNEESEATTPIMKPVHDWTSHYRTAMEYFCVNIGNWKQTRQEAPLWANIKKKWLTNRRRL